MLQLGFWPRLWKSSNRTWCRSTTVIQVGRSASSTSLSRTSVQSTWHSVFRSLSTHSLSRITSTPKVCIKGMCRPRGGQNKALKLLYRLESCSSRGTNISVVTLSTLTSSITSRCGSLRRMTSCSITNSFNSILTTKWTGRKGWITLLRVSHNL